MPSFRRVKNSRTIDPLLIYPGVVGGKCRSHGIICLMIVVIVPMLSAATVIAFQCRVITASLTPKATLMTIYAFAKRGMLSSQQKLDRLSSSPQSGPLPLSRVNHHALSLLRSASHVNDTRSSTRTVTCLDSKLIVLMAITYRECVYGQIRTRATLTLQSSTQKPSTGAIG
jgi:hypothetical protein